jgi:hypothetical protein
MAMTVGQMSWEPFTICCDPHSTTIITLLVLPIAAPAAACPAL